MRSSTAYPSDTEVTATLRVPTTGLQNRLAFLPSTSTSAWQGDGDSGESDDDKKSGFEELHCWLLVVKANELFA